MDACCEKKAKDLELIRARHRPLLLWVLGINGAMFFVELAAGIQARSSGLLADSLDMFGDATVYALSLFALSRGVRWRARASLAKGVIMLVFGLGVIVEALRVLFQSDVPRADTMGVIGTLALVANGICFGLLYRTRSDDLNMRSTWLCSRNDIIANLSVLAASIAVGLLHRGWPDVVVGLGIAALFLHSAFSVIRESLSELRLAPPATEG